MNSPGKFLLFLAALASCPSHAWPATAALPTVDAVRAELELRSRKIGGYHAKFRQIGFDGTGQSAKQIWEHSWTVQGYGRSIRCEREVVSGVNADSHFFDAWCWLDSEGTGSSYGEFRNVPPANRYNGLLFNKLSSSFGVMHWTTPIEYFTLDFESDISSTTRLGTWKIGQERHSDRFGKLTVLEGDVSDPAARDTVAVSFEIWLAPERDWIPVKIKMTSLWHGTRETWTEYEVDEIEKSQTVFVPKAARLWFHYPPSEQAVGAVPNGATSCTFIFSRFDTGLKFEDESIRLKLPVGASIFDDITKESFIAGKVMFVMDGTMTFVKPLDADHPLHLWTDRSRGITDAEWSEWSAGLPWLDAHATKLPARIAAEVHPSAHSKVPIATSNRLPIGLVVTGIILGALGISAAVYRSVSRRTS